MGDAEKAPLPLGWTWSKLGDVCDVAGGVTVDAKRRGPDLVEVPYLRVANVQRGRLDLSTMKHIAVPQAQAERLRLRPGDVLLNEGGDRDKVGRGWVWEGQIENCIFQNHVFRARPRHESIQPRWLSHYLNEAARPYFLSGSKQTTNLASLSLTKVAATPIAVPPVSEQRRLVEVIDALLAEVDEAEAAMKRAHGQMTDYRASLLHAACTGALTADWRVANPHPVEDGPALLRRILAERRAAWERTELARPAARNLPSRRKVSTKRYTEPRQLDLARLPELPSNWTWASLDQLITSGPTNGFSPPVSADVVGTMSLKLTATTQGRLDLSKDAVKYLSQVVNPDSPLFLRHGDLLFQRGNTPEYVGIAAIFDGPERTYVYPDLMIRVRSGHRLLTEWLWRVANSPSGRHYMRSLAGGTAGSMPKINAKILRHIPIPLPPWHEMEAVLNVISRCDDNLREQEHQSTQQKQIADLRRSILHAAFSGHLVPQDPADEPAAALLARLRAEAVPRARTVQPKAPRP